MPNNNEIPSRLALIIKEKGINKAELSRILEFSEGTIGLYFRGVKNPGPKFLRLLEEKLNVNPAWVRYGQGSMFLDGSGMPEEEKEPEISPEMEKVFKLYELASKGDDEAAELLIQMIELKLKISKK